MNLEEAGGRGGTGGSGSSGGMVFLISQPRAGSTMTQRMLGSHPSVHTQAEPWVLLHPLHSLRQDNVVATYSHKVNVRGTRGFVASLPGGESEYWRELGAAYSRMYMSVLQARGKRIFLDKTPRYYLVANDLPRLFPDCRIVCLIRNPLAVLNSIVSTWAREKLFTLCRYRQDLLEAPQVIAEFLAEPRPGTIFVRYEELVRDPAGGMSELCSKLGISYEPSMVEYNRGAAFALGDQTRVDRLSAPDASLQDGWISALEDPQIWRLQREYFDMVGAEVFSSLGYDPGLLEDLIASRRPTELALRNTVSLGVLLDDQRDPLIALHRLQRELEAVRQEKSQISRSLEFRLGRVLTAPLVGLKGLLGYGQNRQSRRQRE